MRQRAAIEVGRMTDAQLWSRLISDTYDLQQVPVTMGDLKRQRAVPSELRAIANELHMRGFQGRLDDLA